jgi:hypothetical protein
MYMIQYESIKMVELTAEDLRFKKSALAPSENLILAAIALETTEHVKSKYGQATIYSQKSVIGTLMSILGLKTTETDHIKKSQYEHRLIDMLSRYVFERIITMDREQKRTAPEIAEWLTRMADFTEKVN